MLSVNEFGGGPFNSCKNLTLATTFAPEAPSYLVTMHGERVLAVALAGPEQFQSIDVTYHPFLQGLLVPEVRIEVDEKSSFDPQAVTQSHAGTLIRASSHLYLSAAGRFRERVPLQEGLPEIQEYMQIGFYKWAIVIGTGLERRQLIEIDASPNQS